jgi:hypothetical protein
VRAASDSPISVYASAPCSLKRKTHLDKLWNVLEQFRHDGGMDGGEMDWTANATLYLGIGISGQGTVDIVIWQSAAEVLPTRPFLHCACIEIADGGAPLHCPPLFASFSPPRASTPTPTPNTTAYFPTAQIAPAAASSSHG